MCYVYSQVRNGAYSLMCHHSDITEFWIYNKWSSSLSILTWHELNCDQLGSRFSPRPFHCTEVGLQTRALHCLPGNIFYLRFPWRGANIMSLISIFHAQQCWVDLKLLSYYWVPKYSIRSTLSGLPPSA